MLHLKTEIIGGGGGRAGAGRQNILKTVFKTKESKESLRVVSVIV